MAGWRLENERTIIYKVINEGVFFDNVKDDSGSKNRPAADRSLDQKCRLPACYQCR